MLEFIDSFHTENQCLEYLEALKWGWSCPKCGTGKQWKMKGRKSLICSECRAMLSVTAWTVLHRIRIPLRTVFLIAWFMVTSKQGISAEELSQMLAIDTKTAWLWNHKIRKIMVLDDRKKLSWDVEVDEVFIGWVQEWKRWRWAEGKVQVVVAVEVNKTIPNKKWLFQWMGRVRIQVIPNCGANTLTKFVQENIETWSTLYTDWWKSYSQIESSGYKHIIETKGVNDSEVSGIHTPEVTPNVHIIASLMKRWLLGTHQKYMVQDWYLQDYLEEYTFRFNRRKSSDRWKLFKTLLEQILSHAPTSRNKLKTG